MTASSPTPRFYGSSSRSRLFHLCVLLIVGPWVEADTALVPTVRTISCSSTAFSCLLVKKPRQSSSWQAPPPPSYATRIPSYYENSFFANPSMGLTTKIRMTSTSLASTVPGTFFLDKTVALASLGAITKVLVSIGLGALATRRPNLLDQQALSVLSRLTYWIFQPAFLLCSVGQTLFDATCMAGSSTGTLVAATGGGASCLSLSMLALLPIVALIQISMGALAGMLWTKSGRFSRTTTLEIRMCSAFANSGPLPLIFANSLFASNAGLLNEIAACISFYLLVWSPLFWTFGRVLLGIAPQRSTTDSTTPAGRLWQPFRAQLQLFLSPPVIGCLLGIALGGIPVWNKHVFGKNAILSPLLGSCKSLGTAYLPAALLVLAGSLVGSRPKPVNPGNTTANDTTSSNRISMSTPDSTSSSTGSAVGAIALSRWILAPILSYGLIQILNVVGPFSSASGRAKAIVTFVILLEACTPPAQNSVIMLQLENETQRAQHMARLLTVLYAISVVPITILLSACLATSNILKYI